MGKFSILKIGDQSLILEWPFKHSCFLYNTWVTFVFMECMSYYYWGPQTHPCKTVRGSANLMAALTAHIKTRHSAYVDFI